MTATPGEIQGEVVAAHGRHYLVETGAGAFIRCVPRGKKSLVACGDRVAILCSGRDEGVIEDIAPRTSLFLRAAVHRRKLIAANATQIAIVVAGEPSFSEELVARVLAAAAHERLATLIVLNKADLADATRAARGRLGPFVTAGHSLLEISARGDVAPLRERLRGHTTALVGQSGMGKSTIVNALVPEADAATREISHFLDAGRHTTTSARLYRLDAASALIDSPGLQDFGLAHLSAAEIEDGFPDIARLAPQCRFRDCRHRTEPDCAVTAAVERGEVHPRRLGLLHRILDAEAGSR